MKKKSLAIIICLILLGSATAVYALKVIMPYRIYPNTVLTSGTLINLKCGSMWYHNHTPTELNFVVDEYHKLFMDQPGCASGFTYGGGWDVESNLTSLNSGKYLVNYMVSSSGQNNHIYYSTVFTNEVINYNCENHKKLTAGGDIITQSGNCIIDLEMGDIVSLGIMDNIEGGIGEYYSANLILVRIGDV